MIKREKLRKKETNFKSLKGAKINIGLIHFHITVSFLKYILYV